MISGDSERSDVLANKLFPPKNVNQSSGIFEIDTGFVEIRYLRVDTFLFIYNCYLSAKILSDNDHHKKDVETLVYS